jgi:hypothetical protein
MYPSDFTSFDLDFTVLDGEWPQSKRAKHEAVACED